MDYNPSGLFFSIDYSAEWVSKTAYKIIILHDTVIKRCEVKKNTRWDLIGKLSVFIPGSFSNAISFFFFFFWLLKKPNNKPTPPPPKKLQMLTTGLGRNCSTTHCYYFCLGTLEKLPKCIPSRVPKCPKVCLGIIKKLWKERNFKIGWGGSCWWLVFVFANSNYFS